MIDAPGAGSGAPDAALVPWTPQGLASELTPDEEVMPEGFLVTSDDGTRIHFLDWGGPESPSDANVPRVLLIHGLLATAWTWSSVARRLRARARVVAMDLRGHGLSDPTTGGYDEEHLVADVLAVAEAGGIWVDADDSAQGVSGMTGSAHPLVIAGHGYGAIVAAWAARAIGERCAGLIFVDGGWEHLGEATGMEPDEWLGQIEEPPEVLRSMAAYIADRAGFDPASWDADAERAARSQVVETAAGRVKVAVQPWAVAASVSAMWSYDPGDVVPQVEAGIIALVAGDDAARLARLADVAAARAVAGRSPIKVVVRSGLGHGLPRSIPGDVAAAILEAGQPR